MWRQADNSILDFPGGEGSGLEKARRQAYTATGQGAPTPIDY